MPQIYVDPIIPSEQDAELAKKAQLTLESGDASGKATRVQIYADGPEPTTVDLPSVVAKLLMDALKETAAGKAVSLVAVEAEITTQQAASLLNISRPHLIGLIDKGLLLARLVGNQRRLPLRDVLEYKSANRAKRHKILDEMAAIDQELGLV